MLKSIENTTSIKLYFCGRKLNLKKSSVADIRDPKKAFQVIVYETNNTLTQSLYAWEWKENYMLQDMEYDKHYGIPSVSWDCYEDVGFATIKKNSYSGFYMLHIYDDINLANFTKKQKKKPKIKKVASYENDYTSSIVEPVGSYVYFHRLKSKEVPFYIGKGTSKRYKDKVRNNACNRMWQNNDCEVIIFKDNLTSEDALELESKLIQKFSSQGVVLTNITD